VTAPAPAADGDGVRVVIADDSLLFREGLVRILSELGHEVVAAVADADTLRTAVLDLAPDVAVIDVRMPPHLESDGARTAVSLRQTGATAGLLLLSQHIALRDCLPLIGTPGFGYLLKDRVLQLNEFHHAVLRVARGGTALDPEVVQALVQARTIPNALSVLSQRERTVLALVAEGHANAAVAIRLSLSDRTVEAHMRSVFTKLGLHDDGSTHRRVLAVLTWLEARATSPP
jgi:DNA-binding NarL/FixJ family response regulator